MEQSRHNQVVILAGLVFFGFLLTSISSYFSARDSLSSQRFEAELPLVSDVINSEIRDRLREPIEISAHLANNTFLHDWVRAGELERAEIDEYLKSVMVNDQMSTSYFISDRTLEYYHPNGQQRTVDLNDAESIWYSHAREMDRPFDYIISVDEMNNDRLALFTNYKVIDHEGAFLGVAGVGLALTDFKSTLDGFFDRYGSHAYFVDKQGQVVVAGEKYRGESNINDKSWSGSDMAMVVCAEGHSFRSGFGGGEVFVISQYLPEVGWYLIVERRVEESIWYQNKTFLSNLGIAVIFTLIVLGIANLTIRKYQVRLEQHANQLQTANNELTRALDEVKTLQGILPICSFCKNIRNDQGYFERIESYMHTHSGVDFSHTVCPSCAIENYPDLYEEMLGKKK